MQQSYGEAARLYRGGGLGIGECQFVGQLGLLYVIARGVPQSYEEAHRLWSLAAEQGDSAAQCCIRTLYEGGLGSQEIQIDRSRMVSEVSGAGVREGRRSSEGSLMRFYRNKQMN